jgi:hypothetical protein
VKGLIRSWCFGRRWGLTLFRYKSCQARVLDFKREFVLAAQKYYILSNTLEIAETERVEALSAAIICAGMRLSKTF